MAASVPESEMLFAVTVLATPMFLLLNVAVPDTVNESPEMRSSEYVAVAVARPLYARSVVVNVTVSVFVVIAAVAVGAPVRLNE